MKLTGILNGAILFGVGLVIGNRMKVNNARKEQPNESTKNEIGVGNQTRRHNNRDGDTNITNVTSVYSYSDKASDTVIGLKPDMAAASSVSEDLRQTMGSLEKSLQELKTQVSELREMNNIHHEHTEKHSHYQNIYFSDPDVFNKILVDNGFFTAECVDSIISVFIHHPEDICGKTLHGPNVYGILSQNGTGYKFTIHHYSDKISINQDSMISASSQQNSSTSQNNAT